MINLLAPVIGAAAGDASGACGRLEMKGQEPVNRRGDRPGGSGAGGWPDARAAGKPAPAPAPVAYRRGTGAAGDGAARARRGDRIARRRAEPALWYPAARRGGKATRASCNSAARPACSTSTSTRCAREPSRSPAHVEARMRERRGRRRSGRLYPRGGGPPVTGGNPVLSLFVAYPRDNQGI